MTGAGLITVSTKLSVADAVDRFEDAIRNNGLLVYARIDHGTNAQEFQMPLRPTSLVIFGHPKGGTPLMMENKLIGIDLPFKALVWENEEGDTWITYNDPQWLAE